MHIPFVFAHPDNWQIKTEIPIGEHTGYKNVLLGTSYKTHHATESNSFVSCLFYSNICVTLILYVFIRYLRAPSEFVMFHFSAFDTNRTNMFNSEYCPLVLCEVEWILQHNITILFSIVYIFHDVYCNITLLFCVLTIMLYIWLSIVNYMSIGDHKQSIYLFVLIICNTIHILQLFIYVNYSIHCCFSSECYVYSPINGTNTKGRWSK